MKEAAKTYITITAALTVIALISAGIAAVILWAYTLENKTAQAAIAVILIVILGAAATTAAAHAPLEDTDKC